MGTKHSLSHNRSYLRSGVEYFCSVTFYYIANIRVENFMALAYQVLFLGLQFQFGRSMMHGFLLDLHKSAYADVIFLLST